MTYVPMDIVYLLLAECFYRLKLCESWRGLQKTESGFTKEDKEALNALVALLLLPIFGREYGIPCKVENLAKHVIWRVCRKAWMWDSKPHNKWFISQKINFDDRSKEYVKKCIHDLICAYIERTSYMYACDLATGRLSRSNESYQGSYSFTSMIARPVVTEEEVELLVSWICDDLSQPDANTLLLYGVAKHIATCIEFQEVEANVREDAKNGIEQTVNNLLLNFDKYPVVRQIACGEGEYGKLNGLIKSLSWARYTIRWQGHYMPIRCSILCHMLETACFGYLAAQEKLRATEDEDERQEISLLCEKTFSWGLFHDAVEIWTDDIPSPAKDGMKIRDLVEDQEKIALEEHFYPHLPEYVASYFRDRVMIESSCSEKEKLFYKSADYFSADAECWWNLRAGASDKRLFNVLERSLKDNRTACQMTVVQFFLLELAGRPVYI